jgi:type VI protein secretion system component Hcp
MKIAHAGALLMALLATSSAVAQTPQSQPQPMQTAALIRFDGVRGESQSKPGWIDASSLTLTCGDAQTVQAGDAVAGTQSPRTLTFTHRMDAAAPALFDAATSGKRFRTAEVDQRGTRLRIEDLQITRVIEDARGTNRATQTVTLTFGRCTGQ